MARPVNDDDEGLTIRGFRAMVSRTPSCAADRSPGTRRWRQLAGDYAGACASRGPQTEHSFFPPMCVLCETWTPKLN